MDFKLYWTASGDVFSATAIDPELTEWFIDTCQGQFRVINNPETTAVETIFSDLQKVNQALVKLNLPLISVPSNILDQRQLNQVHKDWVAIQQLHSSFDTLLYRIDPDLFESFHLTNNKVHEIERSFNYAMRTPEFKKFPNPFYGRKFSPGKFNISLIYSDFGRNSWEKFVNGEVEPNDAELSQWQLVGENININLVRPYNITWPTDFINWCQQHTIEPVYNKLPLGNMLEQDLTEAREIMVKNMHRPDNYLRMSKS